MLYTQNVLSKVIPLIAFIILKFKKITMFKNYIYSFIVILVSFLFIFVSCADTTTPPTTNNTVSFSVSEDASLNHNIGQVEIPNDSNNLSFEITQGDPDEQFSIDDEGNIILVKALDFETTPIYSLTISVFDADDNTTIATITVTINVLNEDDPPMTSFSFFTIDENVANGTTVGTVTASDSDGSITAYNIIAGNDDGKFAINTSTGEITTADALDFETRFIYDLTVEFTDNDGLKSDNRIRVIVNNLDEENPTIAASQTFNIDEELPNGTIVGTVIASDDIGITTYTISTGNTGTVFAIDNDGVITVIANIDYEAPSTSFTLTIEVSDAAANTTSANITIAINDINEALPRIFTDTFEVNEQVTSGTTIGTVVALDDNPITTYSITAGDDDSKFAISSTGEITTADALDFETTPSYTLTIEVTDSDNNKVSDDFVINVINDKPPSANPLFFFSIDENVANATTVGTISATDDFGTVAFAIASGNDDGKFAINTSTGEITTAGTIDFETTAQYILTISITDSTEGNVTTTTVNIDVNNLEDASPTIANQMTNVFENLPINSLIYQVIASDDIAVTAYSIMSGDSDNLFTINATTGQVTTKAAIDYESLTDTDRVYTLVIQVSDAAGNNSTGNLEITINDIGDEGIPLILPNQGVTLIGLSPPSGTIIGNFIAIDDGSIVRYTITDLSGFSGDPTDRFTIDNNGQITTVAYRSGTLSIEVEDDDNKTASGTFSINRILPPSTTDKILASRNVINATGFTIGNQIIWVVNNNNNFPVENKVRAFNFSENLADISENTALDFDLTHNNPDATDIVFALDKLWVLDDNYTVYAYNQDGSRDQASDFRIDTSGVYQGITFVNNQFWVVNNFQTRVYNLDGTPDLTKGFSLNFANNRSGGITFYDNHFWTIDNVDNRTIFAYTSDGNRVVNRDIKINPDPSVLSDSSPVGILFLNGRFWYLQQGHGSEEHNTTLYVVTPDGT